MFILLLKMVVFLVGLLVSIAYLTLAERWVLAGMQERKGANVVGPFGLFQPFADGIKLMHKEVIIPTRANLFGFIFAPILTFGISLSAWVVIPWGNDLVFSDLSVGSIYLLAISSLGVYGIMIGGWASGSTYSIFGGIRSAAQMISYEVSIGFIIMSVVISAGSLNLKDIVNAQKDVWFVVIHMPIAIIFFISTLAETNRAPFDLPEAESELAGGYNVEYSSTPFAAFFLAEYGNMIVMSAIITILFFGGWLPPFLFLDFIPGFVWMLTKISIFLFIFIWVRGTLPRYRYDQLMNIGWKIFLPFSFGWCILTAIIVRIVS
jgi:NADH-quinone oxidoreductase subunit H